jgi:hypothetical protein
MSFVSCVRDAQARGEISNEDADNLVARFTELSRSMPPRAARDELQRQLAIQGAMKRRQQMLTVAAHDKMLKDITQFRTASGKKNVFEAGNSLFEDFGYAGYPSARFTGEALIGMAHSRMANFLEKLRRTIPTGRRINKPLMADIERGMFGEKVSPEAKGLADMLSETHEWLRQQFNEKAGDTIPKLENWGGPQSHDPGAVIRAGGFKKDPLKAKANWTKFIDDKLDWSKIRDPFTGEPFGKNVPSQERRTAILGHAWDSIVTDGRIDRAPTKQMMGGASVANSRTDHRFFVFKDADSKRVYDREFGSGDFFSQNMSHIHGMARDIALMDRFGPNPSGEIEYLKQLYDQEAAKAATGKPSMLEGFNHLTVLQKAEGAKTMLDGFYEQYRGANAAQGWMALAGTILRNNAMGSLLGSSVIAHSTSNWAIQSFARYLGGIPIASTIPQLLRSLASHATHAEILRAGLDVENGMFTVGAGARQMGALQKAANWSRWFPDRVTHLTGLIPVVEANKAAFFRGMMSHLADIQKTPWANLETRIKNKLIGYGLNERDWKLIQMAKPYEPSIGSAKWLRPNEVADISDKDPLDILRALGANDLDPTDAADRAQRGAFATAVKLLGYMHGEREVAVPQSSMRVRSIVYGRSEAGTWWGELRRSVGTFKGFIGSFMLTQLQAIQRELIANRYKGAAYIASVFTVMSLMGMLTLQLKQVAALKDPLPMDPRSKEGLGAWARAILTSGSFGIFGDFAQSDMSSFGRGPLETLAGPAFMLPLDAGQGSMDIIRNKLSGANKKPVSGIISDTIQRYLKGNTPLLSTAWPLRGAYQRLVLDQLQYLLDRDAHHKQREQEIRLKNETNQALWWHPGDMLPSRAPQMTPGR